MRFLTWLALLALTSFAVWSQHLALALVIAGTKALLVGFEFMELRHAAWVHGTLFAGGAVTIVLVLTAVT